MDARLVASLALASLTFGGVAAAQAPGAPPRPGTPKTATPEPAPEPPPEPPPPPPPAEPDQSALGAPGESCRARADCRTGLACVSNVCRDEREGTTCGSTAECGGNLRCVDNTCVSNLAVDERKRSRDDGGSSLDEWLAFELEGTHPFVGMSWVGGPTLFVGDGFDEVLGSFSYALRGGVMIDHIELGLEVSPMTHLPSTAYLDPTFQFTGFAGYHIPLTDNVHFPIRGGLGMVAANLPGERVWFQARADLLGVSFLAGHFLIDLHLPSFRFTTDFQDIHGLAWYPGMSASYVF